ncbi:O-antigen ligase family protein [bacterium]|nr:O-antigen ligase family protein [bacterium]
MTIKKFKQLIDSFFNVMFFLLAIGTPLLFTSLTRSVFEVNKLLLLRVIELLVIFVWFFKYLVLKANDEDNNEESSLIFGIFRWKRTGFELGFGIWLLVNIVSTVVSQNIIISIIGSYDRWEGIITTINYIVLFFMIAKNIHLKSSFFWVIGGIIGSTALSSIYGVCQSLGWDFMNWSQDPTFRVFACINNPVHYCAYVSMVVPIGVGLNLYLSSIKGIKSRFSILTRCLAAFFSVLVIISYYYLAVAGFISGSVSTIVFTTFIIVCLYLMGLDIRWLVFISTSLIYYTQFLSFSRATWLGFIGVMPIFYLMATQLLAKKSKTLYIADFFFTSIAVASYVLYDIFQVQETKPYLGIALILILSVWVFVSYFKFDINDQNEESIKYVEKNMSSEEASDSLTDTSLKKNRIGNIFQNFAEKTIDPKYSLVALVLFVVGFYLNYIMKYDSFVGTYVTQPSIYLLHIMMTFGLVYISLLSTGNLKVVISRLSIIAIFSKLQFVAVDPKSVLLYASLLGIFFITGLRGNRYVERDKKKWLILFLIVFGFVITMPSIPGYIDQFAEGKKQESLLVMKAVESKTGSYQKDAEKGTARTSMWKSSVPWIKDYLFLGSGPDTIKYMYPKYRLADYGILEGGHNFTPDRLHNEYLNTLASKGVIGFISFYFGIVLFWFVFVLKDIYAAKADPLRYLSMGCVGGVGIYLGQVLFNFGVVATLVLFYLLMGLAVAIKDIRKNDNG